MNYKMAIIFLLAIELMDEPSSVSTIVLERAGLDFAGLLYTVTSKSSFVFGLMVFEIRVGIS